MIDIATTSIWKITKRLDHVIDYTTKEEKTENREYADLHNAVEYIKASYKTERQFYVTGVNCLVDTALEEMKITKEKYGKTEGTLGYHAFQSFKEGEVTPEIAHEIGVKLAEEIWGDRFEVLVSTHLNTHCYHNHFVINSVSFADGLMYRDNHETYAKIRQVSDSICNEYGLNVLKEKKCRKTNLDYSNFQKYETIKTGYVGIAKDEIDKAIEMAKSYVEFESILKQMDYELTYRAGKLSVCRPPYKRNIRIQRAFGDDYSIENIKHRISVTNRARVPFLDAERITYKSYNSSIKRRKPIGKLARMYLYYCYLLRRYPKVQYTKKVSALLREDVKKLDEYSKQARFLCKNKISTMEDLLIYKNSLESKVYEAKNTRESLWNKYKKVSSEEKMKLKEESKQLTSKIKELSKEVVICTNIEERRIKIKENIEKVEEIQERRERKKDDKFR